MKDLLFIKTKSIFKHKKNNSLHAFSKEKVDLIKKLETQFIPVFVFFLCGSTF